MPQAPNHLQVKLLEIAENARIFADLCDPPTKGAKRGFIGGLRGIRVSLSTDVG
jgi:hypothetical protein